MRDTLQLEYAPLPIYARLLAYAPPPTWELELPTEWLYHGPALGPRRSLTHAPPLTPAFLPAPALLSASAPLPAPAPLLTRAPMKPDFRDRRVSCEHPGCSVGSTRIFKVRHHWVKSRAPSPLTAVRFRGSLIRGRARSALFDKGSQRRELCKSHPSRHNDEAAARSRSIIAVHGIELHSPATWIACQNWSSL